MFHRILDTSLISTHSNVSALLYPPAVAEQETYDLYVKYLYVNLLLNVEDKYSMW